MDNATVVIEKKKPKQCKTIIYTVKEPEGRRCKHHALFGEYCYLHIIEKGKEETKRLRKILDEK